MNVTEEMIEAAMELAQYASYAEIVGGVRENRPQIRKWCDRVFEINNKLEKEKYEAEDALEAAMSSAPTPLAQAYGRHVVWLIERKEPQTAWYAEDFAGRHDWVIDATQALRFKSKTEAEAFPAFQMIKSDPNIVITEHVFIGPTVGVSLTPEQVVRFVLKKADEALRPLADAVYNDNGDMAVSVPFLTSEQCVAAYFASKRIAMIERAALAPVPAREAVEVKPLEFGQGKLCVDTGTYYDAPAVFISTARMPGDVGASAKREGHPLTELLPGDVVLTFPTDKQARLVSDALVNALEALGDVLAERERQKAVEGWTEAHDDSHKRGELAAAAAAYAASSAAQGSSLTSPAIAQELWPWSWEWWKPTNRRRDLIKAGALIIAEIERLDRAGEAGGKQDARHET